MTNDPKGAFHSVKSIYRADYAWGVRGENGGVKGGGCLSPTFYTLQNENPF